LAYGSRMVSRAVAVVLLIGCRSPHADRLDPAIDARATDARLADSAGGGERPDGPIDGPIDGPSDDSDGAPMRRPCTNTFGDALSTTFGRLDGTLVAIVLPGTRSCHGDSTHVHLQIAVNAATYDVAVNIGVDDPVQNDVHSAAVDHALIGPAWSEGWHTGVAVDYPALGVHADAMPLQTRTQNVDALTAELATANHVSIYATGYGPDGAHLVHRNGGGADGLIVTQPLSPTAHARLFSFSDQSF